MRTMIVLFDTNIILDHLLRREPHSNFADSLIERCLYGDINGYIAAHSIPNVFYIMRKLHSSQKRKDMIRNLCGFLTIVGIDQRKIFDSLDNENFDDIEDFLQAECALEINADYIVSRDFDGGFENSIVPVISPKNLLEIINK